MSELFGPYRLLWILAARNQSRIDLVENTEAFNRREVLKRIPVIANDEFNRDLIEAERQGADLQRQAHLRNPHIIDVYATGILNDHFFVSMEYVEGKNLEEYQRERNGPLAPVEAAAIAREVCSQVATLHDFLLTVDGKSQAFLHNDIKPSNIQIRRADNQIRLIDFGSAKSVSFSKNFTRNDWASIAYCSPERLDKGISTTYTDLWSVAVVLYEMLAGRLPYQASTPQQLELVIRSLAPPARLPQSCPPALQAIVYKALSPNVANRYPTARAFAEELQRFCATPAVHAAASAATASLENPTRRVNPSSTNPPPPFRPAAAYPPGPAPFTTHPASFAAAAPAQPRAPQLPRQFPQPIVNMGRAIARKPLGCTTRAALVAIVLYTMLSGCSAHNRAQSLYTSLEKQDFPAMSASDIDNEAARLHGLREGAWGRFFAFTSGIRGAIKPRLMEAAERPINTYRTDPNRTPAPAEWQHARACLNFATEIDGSDKLARSELALVDGHLDRLRKKYPDAREKFNEAASIAHDSPDPWIALAYLDAYQDHNLQALLDDQNKEQQRHFTLGPREAAQRGDVFMFLGHKALNAANLWRRKNSAEEETRFLKEADNDFEQADKSYDGSRNWFRTEAVIEQIHKLRATIAQRLTELAATPDGSSK